MVVNYLWCTLTFFSGKYRRFFIPMPSFAILLYRDGFRIFLRTSEKTAMTRAFEGVGWTC